MLKNCFHHMHVVGHAQLVWNRKQDGIGLGDRLVFSQLLDENIRFSSVAATKDCSSICVEQADVIVSVAIVVVSEVSSVEIVH